MKNNFYEEKYMKSEVIKTHRDAVNGLNIPNWLKDLDCPHCDAKLKPEGIRNVSICLNAKNIGDICVEHHCSECGIMDSIYFRGAVKSCISEFCDYINGDREPEAEPVVEEEMYKLRYNNLVENYLK